MEERQNRFIVLPDEYEENSILKQIKNEAQEVFHKPEQVEQTDGDNSIEGSPLEVENYVQIDLSQEELDTHESEDGEDSAVLSSELRSNDSPNVLEDKAVPQEEKNDSAFDLGDLGIVNRDEEGRIIFDVDTDMNSMADSTSVSSEVDSTLEEVVSIEEPIDIEETVGQVDSSLAEESIEVQPSSFDSEIVEEEPLSRKQREFQTSRNLQDMINKILKIDELQPVEVAIVGAEPVSEESDASPVSDIKQKKEPDFHQEIFEMVHEEAKPVVFKSDILEKLKDYTEKTGTSSMLVRYGEDYCNKDFVTNPAIGREEEIKQLILTLLIPEKSAILIGKPGIGKTSIVEGLAYRLQRNDVPEALQGFAIVNIKTPSLLGTLPNGETRLQTLVDELKSLDHVILFIDEIHMLIGATNESAMDFANMFKEGLGRGQIKVIGATTTEEYERYILRDKAFVRRFQSIEVLEPSREHTIKILMGTLPKIEKETGAKLKYTSFIQSEIMAFLTDITSEYKRVYGIGSRYPDICLTLLKEAFSQCIFQNRDLVTIFDIRQAIQNSKNIYPDVIRKELPKFDEHFKKIIDEEIADDASIDFL